MAVVVMPEKGTKELSEESDLGEGTKKFRDAKTVQI